MADPIRSDDRVADVIARDERLVDVFVSASPAFERLRKPWMRKTMAKLVTVSQAARVGGVDPELLLARLNAACGIDVAPTLARSAETIASPPAHDEIDAELRALPAERIVDVDVRDDLRAGREPLRRILDAARALEEGRVLRVRATFEPVPLYAVLARLGLGHTTERLGDEDWRIWFRRGAPVDDERRASSSASASASAPTASGADDVVVLDVRGLEPPDPMMRTLEALARLPRGATLVQLNARVPQHLLPLLEERGFEHEVHEQGPELVHVVIRHRPVGEPTP